MPIPKICSTCAHYDPETGHNLPEGYGICSRVDMHDEDYPEATKAPAVLVFRADDDQGLCCELAVRSDFSCQSHTLGLRK